MEISERDLIAKLVQLGHLIRGQRMEGNLQTVPPPTIRGYLCFLKMANRLEERMNYQQIAAVTLLGNACSEDQTIATGLFNEVFGVESKPDDKSSVSGIYF